MTYSLSILNKYAVCKINFPTSRVNKLETKLFSNFPTLAVVTGIGATAPVNVTGLKVKGHFYFT